MNYDEHIARAEQLLESAKEIAKRPKESDIDRKNDQHMVVDLLDFSRAHSMIAQAMATAGRRGYGEE